MTVSYFEALEAQIPAVTARRKMDLAEAGVYPQLDQRHARQLWDHWERMAAPPAPAAHDGGSLFYLNGKPISAVDLKHRLAGALGAGLTA